MVRLARPVHRQVASPALRLAQGQAQMRPAIRGLAASARLARPVTASPTGGVPGFAPGPGTRPDAPGIRGLAASARLARPAYRQVAFPALRLTQGQARQLPPAGPAPGGAPGAARGPPTVDALRATDGGRATFAAIAPVAAPAATLAATPAAPTPAAPGAPGAMTLALLLMMVVL